MAVCDHCKKEMLGEGKEGCCVKQVSIGKKMYKRQDTSGEQGDCGDCGVKAGKGVHHHPGCDIALCPKCGGQEIGCDCKGFAWIVTEKVKVVG